MICQIKRKDKQVEVYAPNGQISSAFTSYINKNKSIDDSLDDWVYSFNTDVLNNYKSGFGTEVSKFYSVPKSKLQSLVELEKEIKSNNRSAVKEFINSNKLKTPISEDLFIDNVMKDPSLIEILLDEKLQTIGFPLNSLHKDILVSTDENYEVHRELIESHINDYKNLIEDNYLPDNGLYTQALVEAKKELNKMLGNKIEFKTLTQNMSEAVNNNFITHGAFHNGVIYLSEEGAKDGTVYHEAFHAVWRTLLTKEEVQRYMREAKSRYSFTEEELNQRKNKLREIHKNNLTDAQLEELVYEEQLAEDFQAYALTNKQPDNWVQALFKLLLDFIRSYFTNESKIDLLYSKINNRGFRFTKAKNNHLMSVPVYNAIKIGVEVDSITKSIKAVYANQQQTEELINEIYNVAYNKMQEYVSENSNEDDTVNVKDLATFIRDEIKTYMNEKSNFYNTLKNKDLKNKIKKLKEEGKEDTANKLKETADVRKKMYDYTENGEVILERVSNRFQKLNVVNPIADIQAFDDDYEEAIADNREMRDISVVNIGGYNIVDQQVRDYFSTLSYIDKDEMFDQDVIKLVDGSELYNDLLVIMANKLLNPESFMNMLKINSNVNKKVKTLYDKLKAKTNYETDDFNADDQLLRILVKTFNLNKITYLQHLRDPNTNEHRFFVANSITIEEKIIKQWSDKWVSLNLTNKYILIDSDVAKQNTNSLVVHENNITSVALTDLFEQSEEHDSMLDIDYRIYQFLNNTATRDETGAIKTVYSFEQALGVSLTPALLRYSILHSAFNNVTGTVQERLKKFKSQLTELGQSAEYEFFEYYFNLKARPLEKSDFKYINEALRDLRKRNEIVSKNVGKKYFDQSLLSTMNIFRPTRYELDSKEQAEISDVYVRMKAIAKANIMFNNNLVPTSIQDAHQNKRFSYVQQSNESIKAEMLKDEEYRRNILQSNDMRVSTNILINGGLTYAPQLAKLTFDSSFGFIYSGDTRQTRVIGFNNKGERVGSTETSTTKDAEGATSKTIDGRSLHMIMLDGYASRVVKNVDYKEVQGDGNRISNNSTVEYAYYYNKVFTEKNTDQLVLLPVGTLKVNNGVVTNAHFTSSGKITNDGFEALLIMFNQEVGSITEAGAKIQKLYAEYKQFQTEAAQNNVNTAIAEKNRLIAAVTNIRSLVAVITNAVDKYLEANPDLEGKTFNEIVSNLDIYQNIKTKIETILNSNQELLSSYNTSGNVEQLIEDVIQNSDVVFNSTLDGTASFISIHQSVINQASDIQDKLYKDYHIIFDKEGNIKDTGRKTKLWRFQQYINYFKTNPDAQKLYPLGYDFALELELRIKAYNEALTNLLKEKTNSTVKEYNSAQLNLERFINDARNKPKPFREFTNAYMNNSMNNTLNTFAKEGIVDIEYSNNLGRNRIVNNHYITSLVSIDYFYESFKKILSSVPAWTAITFKASRDASNKPNRPNQMNLRDYLLDGPRRNESLLSLLDGLLKSNTETNNYLELFLPSFKDYQRLVETINGTIDKSERLSNTEMIQLMSTLITQLKNGNGQFSASLPAAQSKFEKLLKNFNDQKNQEGFKIENLIQYLSEQTDSTSKDLQFIAEALFDKYKTVEAFEKALNKHITLYELYNGTEDVDGELSKLLNESEKRNVNTFTTLMSNIENNPNLIQSIGYDNFVFDFVVNNYINTSQYQDLIDGDIKTRKDSADAVKRNGGAIAYGPNNGEGTFKVGFFNSIKEDINLDGEEHSLDRTDAQAYLIDTRYFEIQQRQGRSPENIQKIYNKILLGEKVSFEEVNSLNKFRSTLNSVKGVLYSGEHYHKLSYAILTKEWVGIIPEMNKSTAKHLRREIKQLMNEQLKSYNAERQQKINSLLQALNSLYVARPGKETLFKMYMQAQELGLGELLPSSASKLKTVVVSNKDSNDEFDFRYSNDTFNNSDWRLQVEVPSGKDKITYFTQVLHLIDNEQNLNATTTINGQETKVSDLVTEYRQLIAERIRIAMINARNELWKMIDNGDFQFEQKNLEMLRKRMYETVQDSAGDEVVLEFFRELSLDKKKSKYNWNLGPTRKKFEQLFITHFNKGVLSHKAAGGKVSLVSDFGNNVVYNISTGEIINQNKIEQNPSVYMNPDGTLKAGYSTRRLAWNNPSFANTIVYEDYTKERKTVTIEQEHVVRMHNLLLNKPELKENFEKLIKKYYDVTLDDILNNTGKFFEDAEVNNKVTALLYKTLVSNLRNIITNDKISESDKENEKKEYQKLHSNIIGKEILKFNLISGVDATVEQSFAEAILPIRFKELYNLKPGDVVSPENKEAYEKLMEHFGSRIPTQDKHSMIAFKIVDFLPVYMGDSGIFPMEIILLSGADFDIDSLYFLRYNFYVEKAKKKSKKGVDVISKIYIHGNEDMTDKNMKPEEKEEREFESYMVHVAKNNKYVKGLMSDYTEEPEVKEQLSTFDSELDKIKNELKTVNLALEEVKNSKEVQLELIKKQTDDVLYLNFFGELDIESAKELLYEFKQGVIDKAFSNITVFNQLVDNEDGKLDSIFLYGQKQKEFNILKKNILNKIRSRSIEGLTDAQIYLGKAFYTKDIDTYYTDAEKQYVKEFFDFKNGEEENFFEIIKSYNEFKQQLLTQVDKRSIVEQLKEKRAYDDEILDLYLDRLEEVESGETEDIIDSYKFTIENLDTKVREYVNRKKALYERLELLEEQRKNLKKQLQLRAMKEARLPLTPEELKRDENQNISKLENRLLDINIALLNQGSMRDIHLIPVSLDKLHGTDANNLGTSRYMSMLSGKNIGNFDYNTVDGKMFSKTSNKVGNALIGPAAITNVVNALFKKSGAINGEYIYDVEFELDSERNVVLKKDASGKLVRKHGRINEELSTILSAMTDNGKHNDAFKLAFSSLNNIGVYLFEISMGLGINEVAIFANQPIIELYNSLTLTNNAKIAKNETFKANPIKQSKAILSKIINDSFTVNVKQELEILNNLPSDELLERQIEAVRIINNFLKENNIQSLEDTKSVIDALKNMTDSNKKTKLMNAFILQDKVINRFEGSQKLSRNYQNLSIILAMHKGIKPSFDNIDKIDEVLAYFGVNVIYDPDTKNIDISFDDVPDHILDIKPIIENVPYVRELITAHAIIKHESKQFIMTRSNDFVNIQESIKNNLSYVNYADKKAIVESLPNAISSYLFNRAFIKYSNSSGLNIIPTSFTFVSDSNNLQNRINQALQNNPELGNNTFLNFINVTTTNKLKSVISSNKQLEQSLQSDSRFNQVKIDVNTRADMSESEARRVRDGFKDMMLSTKPEVQELAKQLYIYLFLKDGLQFRNGSFLSYISVEMYKELSDVAHRVEKALFNSNLITLNFNQERVHDILGFNSHEDLVNDFISIFASLESHAHIFNNFSNVLLDSDGLKAQYEKANQDVKEAPDSSTIDFNNIISPDDNDFVVNFNDFAFNRTDDYIEAVINKQDEIERIYSNKFETQYNDKGVFKRFLNTIGDTDFLFLSYNELSVDDKEYLVNVVFKEHIKDLINEDIKNLQSQGINDYDKFINRFRIDRNAEYPLNRYEDKVLFDLYRKLTKNLSEIVKNHMKQNNEFKNKIYGLNAITKAFGQVFKQAADQMIAFPKVLSIARRVENEITGKVDIYYDTYLLTDLQNTDYNYEQQSGYLVGRAAKYTKINYLNTEINPYLLTLEEHRSRSIKQLFKIYDMLTEDLNLSLNPELVMQTREIVEKQLLDLSVTNIRPGNTFTTDVNKLFTKNEYDSSLASYFTSDDIIRKELSSSLFTATQVNNMLNNKVKLFTLNSIGEESDTVAGKKRREILSSLRELKPGHKASIIISDTSGKPEQVIIIESKSDMTVVEAVLEFTESSKNKTKKDAASLFKSYSFSATNNAQYENWLGENVDSDSYINLPTDRVFKVAEVISYGEYMRRSTKKSNVVYSNIVISKDKDLIEFYEVNGSAVEQVTTKAQLQKIIFEPDAGKHYFISNTNLLKELDILTKNSQIQNPFASELEIKDANDAVTNKLSEILQQIPSLQKLHFVVKRINQINNLDFTFDIADVITNRKIPLDYNKYLNLAQQIKPELKIAFEQLFEQSIIELNNLYTNFNASLQNLIDTQIGLEEEVKETKPKQAKKETPSSTSPVLNNTARDIINNNFTEKENIKESINGNYYYDGLIYDENSNELSKYDGLKQELLNFNDKNKIINAFKEYTEEIEPVIPLESKFIPVPVSENLIVVFEYDKQNISNSKIIAFAENNFDYGFETYDLTDENIKLISELKDSSPEELKSYINEQKDINC